MELRKFCGVVMISIVLMGMMSEISGKDCSPPPAPKKPSIPPSPSNGGGSGKCPVDALKLGLCVDVLGGLVHVGLGDPKVNKCCPLIKGLVELEAAACLCTTIRAKVLNLNLVVPVALTVFASCDITPPKSFICPK